MSVAAVEFDYKLVTQARTLFLTTTLKHETAAFGRHPRAEAMSTFALDAAWLICAFHFFEKLF